jgi:hypothetical protein
MARTPESEQGGLLAEFADREKLVAAARALVAAGYARLEAYTPTSVPEFEEVVGLPPSPIPWLVFAAGLTGAAIAYSLQYWLIAIDYPLLVGGMPANSAPAFIPITFESTVLFAALCAFLSMLAFARLPRLWHPVFEVPGFESASVNRFWLAIDSHDAHFDEAASARQLTELGALRVVRVQGAQARSLNAAAPGTVSGER